MKHLLKAALLFAATATAQIDCIDDGGNYYCRLVNAITYLSVGGDGSYNRVTSMDSTSGTCASSPVGYSGSLSPLDEEVSWHFRGPLNLKQFAAYTPSISSTKKSKRSKHVRKHAHMAAHAHGRHAKKQRDVGDMVTATIDGQVVSWTNEYDGAPATTSTSIAPSPEVSTTGEASSSTQSSDASASDAPEDSVGSCWNRTAYYDSAAQTSQGLVFLNHYGGSGSGVFDYTFGNSLSYASCDGQDGASSPQTLEDTTIPSSAEVVIMTDQQCQDDSCGFVRPGSVAYHGFDGASKAFFFEFAMPDSGESTADIYDPVNMPAVWMLNAQIPRTLQYGNEDCSCWSSGCGEFDMFEVLAPGDARAKSTLHGNKAGGDSNYFARPMNSPIKVGMILHDNQIHIKILDSSIDFGSEMDESTVNEILGSTSVQSDMVSLFNLGDAASG